jgi:ribose/xylose/arabinose/galactoside ABC-type transport system permease subunit
MDFCQKNLALVLLLIAGAIFSATTANFLSVTNILNILNQNSYLVIAMCGISLVMIGGDLDMSVGYHMSICGVLCALMLTKTAIPVWIVVLATIVASVALSILTTALTELLAIPRIFVTIGEATLFQGAAYVITNSKTVSSLPVSFKQIAQGTLIHPSLTYATLLMVLCVAIMSFVLRAYPKIISEAPEKSGVEAFARIFPAPFRNFGICTKQDLLWPPRVRHGRQPGGR